MSTVGRPPKDRLLDLRAVLEIVPVSKAHIYAEVQRKRFPAPLKVGRSSYWRLTEVERWMAGLQPAITGGRDE